MHVCACVFVCVYMHVCVCVCMHVCVCASLSVCPCNVSMYAIIEDCTSYDLSVSMSNYSDSKPIVSYVAITGCM